MTAPPAPPLEVTAPHRLVRLLMWVHLGFLISLPFAGLVGSVAHYGPSGWRGLVGWIPVAAYVCVLMETYRLVRPQEV